MFRMDHVPGGIFYASLPPMEENFSDIVRGLRKKLGCAQERLARVMEVSIRTVWRWEQGAKPNLFEYGRVLRLYEVVDELPNHIGLYTLVQWLEHPCPALDNLPPVDLLGSTWATRYKLIPLAKELAQASERPPS